AAPNSLFLLAYKASEPDKNPVGYARLISHSTEPSVTGPKPIELVRLYVDQSAVGQGYGAQLMQACLEQAADDGFETIWLGVWEKNYRAQAFYKRWGFQQVGVHDFVMGKDVQTDLILTRPVEP
ncbi:MAG: GNAT family N-acetyltransferase, partial [Cyanobacteria bacterium P01_H01_bin.58]